MPEEGGPERGAHHSTELEQRLQAVLARVRAAEQRFGRVPGSVQLLPVSKTRPAADIARVAAAGFSAFGESYLQEAEAKMDALAALKLCWHFIGPLQSNKTRPIAERFHWVHSVSRAKIARRLSEQRPADLPPLNVCLQLNVSGEAAKAGVTPAELPALAEQVAGLPRLQLRGLMAIPAATEDFAAQRAAFAAVREAFNSLQRPLNLKGCPWDTLSMGMSGDLEAAIAEGATLVRVGTDIFGPRSKPR
jgi:pyridoxal phosphate enzyme (YggS family)